MSKLSNLVPPASTALSNNLPATPFSVVPGVLNRPTISPLALTIAWPPSVVIRVPFLTSSTLTSPTLQYASGFSFLVLERSLENSFFSLSILTSTSLTSTSSTFTSSTSLTSTSLVSTFISSAFTSLDLSSNFFAASLASTSLVLSITDLILAEYSTNWVYEGFSIPSAFNWASALDCISCSYLSNLAFQKYASPHKPR